MPSSQAAATERRANDNRTVTHEPPKLKTTLKTPPKQATNPLQFVKVGPCSLYRTAQEQLQKVQEVKKIKQEIRDDPEDWQSNLDNWKSSRRKRQEHIIERVVEVKKLELEEHDRHRRRNCKTFSEMMEERGNRGRKLSLSLAMYQEDDANDLSDLGIGTSSGKSSVSGDTHDDAHSVLSDRDSEIDKNHSDVDNASHENGNDRNDNSCSTATTNPTSPDISTSESTTLTSSPLKKESLNNGFHKSGSANNHNNSSQQEYDSATTATASSPEPEEYAFESPVNRGYVNRVAHNLPKHSDFGGALSKSGSNVSLNAVPVVKVDILKRREIFEKASRDSVENKNNNNRLDFANTKSIKERLSILERQKSESEEKLSPRHSVELKADAVRERFNRDMDFEKQLVISKTRDLPEELETVKPLRERLENLEKLVCGEQRFSTSEQLNSELNAKSIKDRLISLDVNRCKETEKRTANCFHEQTNNRAENSTPSERSSSPDSEYRAPRATFHQSLDSLDADASSGPDTFERVQSLEELDYHQTRRYPASSSSAEILNDTDREDSGIHTADASCSVSQADEPIDEEIEKQTQSLQQLVIVEEKTEFRGGSIETTLVESSILSIEEKSDVAENEPCDAVLTEMGTADISSSSSTSTSGPALSANTGHTDPPRTTNAIAPPPLSPTSSQRPIVYQSPRVPPRRSPPEPKPSYLPGLSSSAEPAVSSPLPSPRSPSKIPTPLPRKSSLVSASPTSSPGSPTSSPGSPKFPNGDGGGKLQQKQQTPSEIPVPVKLSPPSPTKRRTVVEVCEKVLVPRGQLQPTPFITVERLTPGDDEVEPPVQNLIQLDEEEEEEEEQPEQPEVQQPIQESAVLVEETKEEEEEEEEEEEQIIVEMEKKVEVEKLKQEEEEPEELQSVEEEPELVPEFPAKMSEAPPVRPTTLALERTSICSDFLSPLSPVSKQILPLSFSSDEEIVTGLSFPLGPPTSVEPPKEKPPPPPIDLSDEENHPIEPLKRLNSTRRIKKELRSRRSDFLGIEGFNDEEFERELTLTKPPDMAAILAEERRIEQLHRRSYDTDSNYEQDSSHERDSGVELGQAEDWTKQPVSPDMSQHSRQSSEPFGASVTSSEEDEISKKEREIIEVLEREEQWRYENNREIDSDIGEKLAHKLRELEEEKMQLERERASAENQTLRMNEENLRKQEELTRQQDEAEALARQQELEKQKQVAEEEKRQEEEEKEEEARLQKEQQLMMKEARRQEDLQRAAEISSQENKPMSPALSSCNEDEYASREVLRVERELLQLEQEELKRQRNNLAYREQKQQQLAEQLQEQWKSLQDVAQAPPPPQPRSQQFNGGNKPIAAAPLNYRSSMPNLQMQEAAAQRRRPPPPPIPPAKPLRLVEQRQRDVTIRNSRIPSADSIPQQVEAPLRPSISTSALAPTQNSSSQQHHGQQMTRQTLQALSAVPRPRIVQADQWVQRRKSDIPRGAHDYNYQHWLIQEAEQRRINEKNQRSPATRNPHLTSTSVPYTASPPRNDTKPLPDSIIQTLTQRVQNRVQDKPLSPRRRLEHSTSQEHLHSPQHYQMQPHKVHQSPNNNNSNSSSNNSTESQEKMLSVSGKKKCSHCGDELGRGAAMIIESLRLFYHMECFKCCVCHVRLGDGLMGTDVRVRNHKLHCHNCYSSDDGTHNYKRTIAIKH
ncbi:titin isoform X2 [Nasonia vitripennis]|uniref:LIM zinc-binding domain-containing protein n=1 Tax=Nasonia vitripennis TaxID=7425 RepID=A0A7M7Q6A1_NASVI|nr:titin isoform X2 [Nasonia vitripennis]